MSNLSSHEYLKKITNSIKQKDIASAWDYLAHLRNYLAQTGTPLDNNLAIEILHVFTSEEIYRQQLSPEAEYAISLVGELQKAANLENIQHQPFDLVALNKAAEDLYDILTRIEQPLSDSTVANVIVSLRRARSFEWLSKLCDRFISRGNQHELLRSYYAQALIETGHLNAAIYMIDGILKTESVSQKQFSELQGHLGRAHKQIYVNHIRTLSDTISKTKQYQHHIQKAYQSYLEIYDPHKPGEQFWHGINIIALLKRAQTDGVTIEKALNPIELANNTIEALKQNTDSADPWVNATLGEAHLAIGKYDIATDYFRKYTQSHSVTSFQLGSTIRQLEEVWRVSATTPGSGVCLAVLKQGAARKLGSSFFITPQERKEIKSLEAFVDGGHNFELDLFKTIIERANSVAWIAHQSKPYKRRGTGFLVHGRQISRKLDDGLYLLTNAHVVYDLKNGKASQQHNSIQPHDTTVIFDFETDNQYHQHYEVEMVWQSPISRHDATLLKIHNTSDKLKAIPVVPESHQVKSGAINDEATGTRVAVIGHPDGGELTLSVNGSLKNMNGRIIDYGPREAGVKTNSYDPMYLHYTAPTSYGNSGSPVFDTGSTNWQLIGLHHAGFQGYGRDKLNGVAGIHQANEGICIQSIRSAIKKGK